MLGEPYYPLWAYVSLCPIPQIQKCREGALRNGLRVVDYLVLPVALKQMAGDF